MNHHHSNDHRAPELTRGPRCSLDAARPQGHLTAQALRRARTDVRRSAWRALENPQFRAYFLGSLVSNLGTWLQNTAQVILAYKLTQSAFAVGLVTCAQFSGTLFLGPWAAVVASRIGGKRMLIATQCASALIAGGLAVLAAAGLLGEGILAVGAFALGLAFTFALPVQMALVPRLAAEADTEAAMTMNSVSYNAGRAVAPGLCVLVIIVLGFPWAFALNAISFAVFAAALAVCRPRPAPRSPGERPARARDGLSIALRQPRIALLLAMVAAVTFADDPVQILGPTLAHHLGVSPDWAGAFLSALGLGTVLGSLGPARDSTALGDAHGASQTSRRAAQSLLLLVMAIALFSLGFSPQVSVLAAFAAGVAALRTGAVTQTQLVMKDPRQAASVMALWAIAWAGTKPLASFLDGTLAGTLGIHAAGIILTLPALMLALAELCLPSPVKGRIRNWAKSAGPGLQRHFETVLSLFASRPALSDSPARHYQDSDTPVTQGSGV
jgi:predicted MFS family arabinose efflux permease